RDRQWDVAIDNPTTLPAWVRNAAQILKDNVDRYMFISTISVYADTGQGVDETAPLAKYDGPDPYKETIEAVKASGYKTYGPLKALSEKEVEKWFPGKTLIIRPGLIVGPRDETDRFTYWPVRIDRGGEALAPGKPSDPVQFIDARDLAEWTIRMAENRETGIYNATGPAKPLAIREMLEEKQRVGTDRRAVRRARRPPSTIRDETHLHQNRRRKAGRSSGALAGFHFLFRRPGWLLCDSASSRQHWREFF